MGDFDVIVVGLGALGSAAAAQLAGRGQRVLGLEQFTPAHDRGSSHGETRMIRQAYFEDPSYVPLLRRAYQLWEDLEAEVPGTFTATGGLMLGTSDTATVAGSLRSARQFDLPHELIDAETIRARFPNFAVTDETIGVFEIRAGYVRAEQTVLTHLARARAAGADLRFNQPVRSWSAETGDGGVTIETADGRHTAESLVLTPGAWAPQLLRGIPVPLAVERQLLFWFEPVGPIERWRTPHQPVFIWQDDDGMQLYGFPAYGKSGDGVKVAFFRGGPPADPDDADRTVHHDEIDTIRARIDRLLPGLSGQFLRGVACMYTNTPDENFVLGHHPEHPQVSVGAGFSGHGFKFTPVVGEILADLTIERATQHPIELFDPARQGR